ncbi:hypothetical protein KY289_002934 [Solanum tuberosum]|nr:hypothetical protein KY289_002934 [Solanum tuberosum]
MAYRLFWSRYSYSLAVLSFSREITKHFDGSLCRIRKNLLRRWSLAGIIEYLKREIAIHGWWGSTIVESHGLRFWTSSSNVCENILVAFVSSIYILNLGISEQYEDIQILLTGQRIECPRPPRVSTNRTKRTKNMW